MSKGLLSVVLYVVLAAGAVAANAATLELDRAVFVPAEVIEVRLKGAGGLVDGAWVGIIPSEVTHGSEAVNDENDVAYEYLDGRADGTLMFTAPSDEGDYDLRLSDGEGREVASVSFKVRAGTSGKAKLELGATVFNPGDSIQVRFVTPVQYSEGAWVGIIPSEVPHGSEDVNDEHDVAYEYLGGKTSGVLTFAAPDKPGAYDLRMHDTDNNGREVASVSFRVRAPDLSRASLAIDVSEVAPGEEIVVHFTAPEGLPENAWVGLIPAVVEHGDESRNDEHDVTYEYLNKRTTGALRFLAPSAGGAYDFRMHDSDSEGHEIAASKVFKVRDQLVVEDLARQLSDRGEVAVYGVSFAVDSAEINASSAAVLATIGELLQRDQSLKLTIEGHTDSTGSAEHNLSLSQRRADSVKQYLVDRFGIDAKRLTTRGLGSTQPVAPNDTESGRAQNRRVELVRS
jgi:outer membrane protein OmpA-like peptidoglycan-associated protein